jgi:LCP family protein required for cell wall assembly
MTNGRKSWAQRSAMFNSAFATGWDMGKDMASAAGCTIKTVQSLTGLTINHFVVVDFAGFQQMVNAIGGVPICIPENYDSPNAKLHVAAGFQTLDGRTALAYARAREGTNMNGSDLQRATRQQQLIAAMIRQVLSKDVLTSVPRLLSFLDAATKSLTVDPGLSHLTDMAGMALSLRGLNTTNITFMTIPVATAPTDRNRVVWTSAATKIWANMVADKPIVASEAAATTPPATTTATPTGATNTAAPAAPSTPAPLPKTYHPGDPFTANNTASVCG